MAVRFQSLENSRCLKEEWHNSKKRLAISKPIFTAPLYRPIYFDQEMPSHLSSTVLLLLPNALTLPPSPPPPPPPRPPTNFPACGHRPPSLAPSVKPITKVKLVLLTPTTEVAVGRGRSSLSYKVGGSREHSSMTSSRPHSHSPFSKICTSNRRSDSVGVDSVDSGGQTVRQTLSFTR